MQAILRPLRPQVAYCAPYMGGMNQANCGKCLRMTNGRTGSQVIVRIVDMCGHGGELSLPAVIYVIQVAAARTRRCHAPSARHAWTRRVAGGG